MLIRMTAMVLVFGYASVAWAETELVRDAPHVWNVGPDTATIAWFTSGDEAEAVLAYGPTEAYGTQVQADSRRWPLLEDGATFYQHVATVTNLEPKQKYHYQVFAGEVSLTPGADEDATYYFVTAPEPGDAGEVTFAVLGDGGKGNKYQRAIAYQLEQVPFDFMLHTGDVVYDYGADAEWHVNYYPVYKNLIRNRPWFLSLGNHEYLAAPAFRVVAPEYASSGERLLTEEEYASSDPKDPNPLVFASQERDDADGYFENAVLPTNADSERYYSFDWGPVHVVVLDSNRSRTPGRPGDDAYQWMVDDLAASDAPWKVVCFHHPMAGIGKDSYTHTSNTLTALRQSWHPVFEEHGVDVIFVGHDHNYQRTHPIVVDPETGDITRDDEHGVVHIVTGGGGGGLSDQSITPPPAWHSGVFHMRHHFLLVKADSKTMRITAIADEDINRRGVTEREGLGGPAEELDSVTLVKEPAAAATSDR